MPTVPGASTTTRAGHVALLGRPNVGKSTLLNALLGEPIAIISAHPQTTRDVVRGVLTQGDTQYVFLDTPGIHAAKTKLGSLMNASAREQAREADAVVLMVEPGPSAEVNPADLGIARELTPGKTILVINKIDRVKEKAKLLPLLAAFSEKLGGVAAVIPMSAKRADGFERLLKEVRELLPEQPFLYEADTLSDQPVRFFVAEFVREQILQHTRQEVPHGVAVVVERFDESTDIPHIEIAIHVAREGHKGILVGAKGAMMKRIGMAARVRVEKMLGRRVHLKMWVRATPDWMNDIGKLRDLGYGPGGAGEGSER